MSRRGPARKRRRVRERDARRAAAQVEELPPGIVERGGGWYELPDGRKVRGFERAVAEVRDQAPSLPEAYVWSGSGRRSFRGETVAAWRRWWASPMAAAWDDGHVPALVRLAILTDVFVRGEANGTVLREIRMLEDGFGLAGPASLQKLDWVLPDDGREELAVESDRGDQRARIVELRERMQAGAS